MVIGGDDKQLDFGKFSISSESELRGDDVFLMVKHYMSSKALSQTPLLVMRAADLQFLDSSRVTPGPNLVVMARNPIGRELAKKYTKTSEAVSLDPWCMDRAAQYLSEWVRQNVEKTLHIDKLWDLEFVLKPWCQEERMDASIAIQWQDFAPQEPKLVSQKRGLPNPGATWAPAGRKTKADVNQKLSLGPKAKKMKPHVALAKSKGKRTRARAESPSVQQEEDLPVDFSDDQAEPGTPCDLST
eukprot:7159025-Pyramimonas_sp.AAC.1